MRVAVDARPLAQPRSGIGRYTKHLLTYMAREPDVEFCLYGCTEEEASDLSALRIRKADSGSRAVKMLQAQFCFQRWARMDDVDVYWSPRHHLPLFLQDIPNVVTIHDLVWRRAGNTMPLSRWLVERLLMPRSVRHACILLVPSQSTAKDLISEFPDVSRQIRVIPLGGSEMNGPQDACCRHAPYVLFVGTLEPRKNLTRVLRAFSQARERASVPHRLLVVGGHGWKNRMDLREISRAESRGAAEYLGPLEDAELFSLYRNADYLVAPSLYEGFGLQVLEALTAGIPVITSKTSSLPEVAGDAGLLVDPTSEEEICKAMTRLFTDRDLHARLKQSASIQARRFSWQRTADATLRALAEAAASRH